MDIKRKLDDNRRDFPGQASTNLSLIAAAIGIWWHNVNGRKEQPIHYPL